MSSVGGKLNKISARSERTLCPGELSTSRWIDVIKVIRILFLKPASFPPSHLLVITSLRPDGLVAAGNLMPRCFTHSSPILPLFTRLFSSSACLSCCCPLTVPLTLLSSVFQAPIAFIFRSRVIVGHLLQVAGLQGGKAAIQDKTCFIEQTLQSLQTVFVSQQQLLACLLLLSCGWTRDWTYNHFSKNMKNKVNLLNECKTKCYFVSNCANFWFCLTS